MSVCVNNRTVRWMLCFLAVPAVWIAGSLGTGLHAVLMIPAALALASLSALTAYRSGLGRRGAIGYLAGTGAAMGIAFAAAVVVIFTVYCGDGTDGAC